eukprot:11044275-Alexandrium_andersonii.AAC.1
MPRQLPPRRGLPRASPHRPPPPVGSPQGRRGLHGLLRAGQGPRRLSRALGLQAQRPALSWCGWLFDCSGGLRAPSMAPRQYACMVDPIRCRDLDPGSRHDRGCFDLASQSDFVVLQCAGAILGASGAGRHHLLEWHHAWVGRSPSLQ